MNLNMWMVVAVLVVIVLSLTKTVQEGFREPQVKACFVGCAKDIAGSLPKTLKKLCDLRRMFHPDSRIIVAENDSKDGTKEILKQFPEITVLNYDGQMGKYKYREEVLAFLRNELLTYAQTHCADFDYFIVADLDGLLDDLEPSEVQEVLRDRHKWDAVFANTGKAGKPSRYYDIYALRSRELGMQYDCLDAHHHGIQNGMSSDTSWSKYVIPYVVPVQTEQDYIPVDSAFGGFGIYKMAFTFGCRYRGLAEGPCTCGNMFRRKGRCRAEVCEHVPFHTCLQAKGARMMIATRLLVQN